MLAGDIFEHAFADGLQLGDVMPTMHKTQCAHLCRPSAVSVHNPRPLKRCPTTPFVPAADTLLHPCPQFTAKGRAPVFAYSNAFGEGGLNGTGLYYVATAADKVFMAPSGMLSLLGFESTQVRLV